MAKFRYEKPLLIDLQKNEALLGYGKTCNPFGSNGTFDPPGAGGSCIAGPDPQGTCDTGGTR